VKDFKDKITENNYKLCLLAERKYNIKLINYYWMFNGIFSSVFTEKAEQTSKNLKNNPKIEMLKKMKAAIQVLKNVHEKTKAENEQLRDELMDLKIKRKKKRYFDKHKKTIVEFREKIFPVLMTDCDKKAELMESLYINDNGNICKFFNSYAILIQIF
jgi:hypothetical protein